MPPVDPPLPATESDLSGEAPRSVSAPASDESLSDRRALRSAPERGEMALVLGLVLLLNVLPGGLLQLAHLRWGLLVTQSLFVAAPVLLAIRLFYLDARAILPIRSTGGAALCGSILGILGLNHVLNFAQAWQERYFPMPEIWRRLFDELTTFNGTLDFILLMMLVGVLPGVCEELLFRGFLQAGLRKSFESDAMAIVVGALVFAAFHLNPWTFASLLIIGLYLGLLVQRTRSLVPAMLAHALNNVQSLVIATLNPRAQQAIVASTWSHALACLCLLAAVLCLRRAPVGSRENRVL